MTDALILTRWRERCLVPRHGRTAEQDGVAMARSLAFQARRAAPLIPVLERVAGKAANPEHKRGLRRALAWLKEEVARG